MTNQNTNSKHYVYVELLDAKLNVMVDYDSRTFDTEAEAEAYASSKRHGYCRATVKAGESPDA